MLHIITGNIVDDEILKGKDVFVLPTNPKMRCGSGVCGAAFKKAGVEKLEKYCEDTFNVGYNAHQQVNAMKPTEIRITPGFGLGMDIIFAQSAPYDIFGKASYEELLDVLIETFRNTLKAIKDNGYKNALLPSLGTGIYGFDHKDVARKVVPMIKNFCEENKGINIWLCLINEQTAKIYRKYL